MYNIKVKSGGAWYDADLSKDTEIAVTLETSEIADASIKGNGSNEIEIPRTPKNERIFGHIGTHQAIASAYSSYPCILYNEGIQLFQGKSKLYVIESSASTYTISIVGQECEMYDRLSDIDLKDEENELLLGTFRIGLGEDWNNIQGIQYGAGYTEQETGREGREIVQQASTPLTGILSRLIGATGCTTDVTPWAGLKVLPAGREPIPWYRDTTIEGAEKWKCHAKMTWHLQDLVREGGVYKAKFKWYELEYGDYSIAGLHIRFISDKQLTDADRYNAIITYYNGGSNEIGVANIMVGDETEEPYGNCGWVANPDGSNTIVRDVAFHQIHRGTTPGGNDPYSLITYMNIGPASSQGYINLGALTLDGLQDVVVEILMPGEKDDSVCWGAKCSYANNLGWKTGLDVYKAALQIAGGICYVEDGQAIMYNLKDVAGNKDNAQDWTNKLLSVKVAYHSDFARKNYISLQENSITDRQDKAFFEVNDEMLEEKNDYIDIQAESGEDETTCSYWEKEVDSDGTITISRNDPSSPYLWDQGNACIIQADKIAGAYSTLAGILGEGYRLLEATMFLEPEDIIRRKAEVPIYLKQFGSYFYVKKITDWQKDLPCQVQLLKL